MAVSTVTASVLGIAYLRKNNEEVIAGGMASSAGLITYNAFRNPQWFKFLRLHPLSWVGALALYGAYYDKAAVGGVAGGYLAFLLAL